MNIKDEVIDRVNDAIENIDCCDCCDEPCDCCNELCESITPDLHLSNPEKGVLDGLQEKLISRKLLVFTVATVLMIWSNLDPDTWGLIAMMYIGGQSAIDLAKTWRHG